jgi:RHS repeat-associated protein
MTVGGVTTHYAYDGSMLVQELQTNAQTGLLAATTTYMIGPWGPICRINETQRTEGYYPAGVNSTSPLSRGVTIWYVYDGLGSIIAELDDNNNMTTSGQYDVYGAPRAGTQQGVTASSSQGYVGSLGHVTDQSTGGLIYMQARYYDPGIGRFVSEDPSRNGNNWYEYALSAPTVDVDGNGKSADPVEEAMKSLHIQIASSYLQIMSKTDETVTGINVLAWTTEFALPSTQLESISATLLEQSEQLLTCANSYRQTAGEFPEGAGYSIEQSAVCDIASEGLRDMRAMLYIEDPDMANPTTF